jgi:hypothetical protein
LHAASCYTLANSIVTGGNGHKAAAAAATEQKKMQMPDLEGLANNLKEALQPYQRKYFSELALANGQESLKFNLRIPKSSPANVWHTFEQTMNKALDNASLHLDADFGLPRNDSSVFVALSSYRDKSCSASLRNAITQAENPSLINVGIVQQNCMSEKGCMTGTGWANTRRWVAQEGPDPDCAKDFCASEEGREHCEAGRVRILRLGEEQAYGPFFARYLNAKLWRGENYFMQIDAHTKFRKGWEKTLIDMMKNTPSYPQSVISTYPPEGKAEDVQLWERAPPQTTTGRTSGLCEAQFEIMPSSNTYTLRMGRTDIPIKKPGVPPYASFVAAGFYFTHGSVISKVPADPFLPYIFMGEEIALSERLWTAGFDIYAPTVEVLQHEYVRSEGPKFWESVNMVYGDGAMHNAISALILERVQNLVGFPEAQRADQVDSTVLAHMDRFGPMKARDRASFLAMAGLDVAGKKQRVPEWCEQGTAPPFAIHKANLIHEL